ncbi:MAG TPA: hypothetical protein VFZ75_06530, partial [Actinomycetota bacterium]|nr:hypothetical protein [Actinomycetota bacterium]
TAHYLAIGAEPAILAPGEGIGGVDALFLPGGDPSLLVSTACGSRSWTEARDGWQAGRAALAGSSAGAMALWEQCLFPTPGADVPTAWSDGLGPLRGGALAVHAASRPESWLEDVGARAPVDVLAMDEGTALLLRPGRAPLALGGGAVTRFPAAAPVASVPG